MSDTLVGVLIGGGITILPIIVNSILNTCEAIKNRKHNEKLKIFEMIIMPKHEAFLLYMYNLGIVIDNSYNHNAIDDYKATYSKVTVLADVDLRTKMTTLHSQILNLWHNDKPESRHSKAQEILTSSLIQEIRQSIFESLEKSLKYLA
jgi:hypothetical protein